MRLTKDHVFLHYFSKFIGILLFVLKYRPYVYFLASEDDKWGFLTSRKSWPVPLITIEYQAGLKINTR